MGDLTANLSRSEFECSCNRAECNRTPVDLMLATGIQDCADHFLAENPDVERVAVHINSGHRCLPYDAELKGKKPEDFNGIKVSEHVWGIAADFWMECVMANGHRIKISDDEIADYLELKYSGKCGIGRYDGRTHFDTRPGAARWDNRGKG